MIGQRIDTFKIDITHFDLITSNITKILAFLFCWKYNDFTNKLPNDTYNDIKIKL